MLLLAPTYTLFALPRLLPAPYATAEIESTFNLTPG